MSTMRQINHVTLIVDDLEAARAFYEGELGFEPLPSFNLIVDARWRIELVRPRWRVPWLASLDRSARINEPTARLRG
jgi:bleomycin resistance family protein